MPMSRTTDSVHPAWDTTDSLVAPALCAAVAVVVLLAAVRAVDGVAAYVRTAVAASAGDWDCWDGGRWSRSSPGLLMKDANVKANMDGQEADVGDPDRYPDREKGDDHQHHHPQYHLYYLYHQHHQRFFARPPSNPAAVLRRALALGPRPHAQALLVGALVVLNVALGVLSVSGGMAEEAATAASESPSSSNSSSPTTSTNTSTTTSNAVLSLVLRRSGALATTNLVPLVLTAGRNGPLALAVAPAVAPETVNRLHRTLGRLIAAESLVHVASWVVLRVRTINEENANENNNSSGSAGSENTATCLARMLTHPFIYCGLVAAVCFVMAATVFAAAPLRRRAYEVFLWIHRALVAAAFAGLWCHLGPFPGRRALLAVAVAAWAGEYGVRVARVVWRNRKGATAVVEVLPGDAMLMRVSVRMPRPWRFAPGQFAYLYMPAVQWWAAHPFSVAWAEKEADAPEETDLEMGTADHVELPDAEHADYHAGPDCRQTRSTRNPRYRRRLSDRKSTTSLVFLIRRRAGFTNALYRAAVAHAAAGHALPLTLAAAAEGPYGARRSLDSYGTVVLFAGGVGISHMVPYLQHLVAGAGAAAGAGAGAGAQAAATVTHQNHRYQPPFPSPPVVAARRIVLVWAVPSATHLSLIAPLMAAAVLPQPGRRAHLLCRLYITRPSPPAPQTGPGPATAMPDASAHIRCFAGRPDPAGILGEMADGEAAGVGVVGKMAVVACGPRGLGDEVRGACRGLAERVNLDLFEEGFGW